MKRLMEKTVFVGLVTAWRLATVPTSRSPACVNATTDGRRAAALGVLDHGRLAALEDGHARVGRSQVDSDRLGHAGLLAAQRSQSG
jgi:hypothetical protein